MKILNLRGIEENSWLKKYSKKQQGTHKFGFSALVVLLSIFV